MAGPCLNPTSFLLICCSDHVIDAMLFDVNVFYDSVLFPVLNLYSNGTSMISLIIPPKDQISRVAKMLADEFGTASNIKSRVNRSVNNYLKFSPSEKAV